MRISDWSSDVCSSDLGPRPPARDDHRAQAAGRRGHRTGAVGQGDRVGRDRPGRRRGGDEVVSAVLSEQPQDRKSVVEGKSVSVRVNRGGRSNVKKKKSHKKIL